jgi:hypothetical protein
LIQPEMGALGKLRIRPKSLSGEFLNHVNQM